MFCLQVFLCVALGCSSGFLALSSCVLNDFWLFYKVLHPVLFFLVCFCPAKTTKPTTFSFFIFFSRQTRKAALRSRRLTLNSAVSPWNQAIPGQQREEPGLTWFCFSGDF